MSSAQTTFLELSTDKSIDLEDEVVFLRFVICRAVTGVNFTDASKESMAPTLKEQMRRAVCPACAWTGYVDTLEGEWRTTCPQGCRNEEGNPYTLRLLLHIPFDADLFHELNVERYELGKTVKILFNPPRRHPRRPILDPRPSRLRR